MKWPGYQYIFCPTTEAHRTFADLQMANMCTHKIVRPFTAPMPSNTLKWKSWLPLTGSAAFSMAFEWLTWLIPVSTMIRVAITASILASALYPSQQTPTVAELFGHFRTFRTETTKRQFNEMAARLELWRYATIGTSGYYSKILPTHIAVALPTRYMSDTSTRWWKYSGWYSKGIF